MNTQQLEQMGIPRACMAVAKLGSGVLARAGYKKSGIRKELARLIADPVAHVDHQHLGELARALVKEDERRRTNARMEGSAPYAQWGDNLDPNSVEQMDIACRLPICVRGALMPDAHLGYGLPIGGVLATRNAVIPYAVGVDIACRMKMSVLDLPVTALNSDVDRLKTAIETETRFGIGADFKKERRQHDVMDSDWRVSPVTKKRKDKAWSQLGTSGSGNHFVEFGVLTVTDAEAGLAPGDYLALLSHSGSRGTGAAVCGHYSKLAQKMHRQYLDNQYRHLAWLDLNTEEGAEYWAAMELMGRYAEANHACIHRHIARHLGVEVMLDIENHHNFAWKEIHDGEEVVVHRKGATPAGEGMVGIIPGSMAAPGYVVRGRGNAASLNSAAHGAGRRMSRTKANKEFNWHFVKQQLADKGVTLMTAGLDEAPGAYKDINEVMAAQSDLVDILARFNPKLVKMAPAGEKPED